ncbi:MAG TPA: phospholipase D-like domain-containing protein, partial [Candidatus Binatia bacterium]|nr:phospholipase D-like domain-containing protein [Candidatus Binatia bacterium]
MASKIKSKNGLKVRAYKGDAMTMLCFDLDQSRTDNCVGFSIECVTPGKRSFFLYNRLSFDKPLTDNNANAAKLSEASTPSDKAPFQKFRWLHVPTSSFDAKEEFGTYKYRVTPRYMTNDKLAPLDTNRTVEIEMEVEPFRKGKLKIGFTRGFMISQAYSRRFGNDTSIRPKNADLLFDTSDTSGTYPEELKFVGGKKYSYKDQYEWMGWQAHDLLFNTLAEIKNDSDITVDIFAYDLDEPDFATKLLELAAVGRIRMILDNSSSHVSSNGKVSPEDVFEEKFRSTATGNAGIVRGRYRRQAHQKTFIIKRNNNPFRVLTGSTNFAVNGLYINANHVIVIENKTIAEKYQQVFDESFAFLSDSAKPKITKLTSQDLFKNEFQFHESSVPELMISFAPHNEASAESILNNMNDAIENAQDSVLFAVMGLEKNTSGPIVATLREIHKEDSIFSYGVTDKYDGIVVFKPASKRGKLVSTKKLQKNLPKPFNREIGTAAHKIHHKFVVIDFRSDNAVAYCGSSNLALLGEQQNGDNLLAIFDKDVATAFAIEAIRLIDHFHFRAALADSNAKDPMVLAKN